MSQEIYNEEEAYRKQIEAKTEILNTIINCSKRINTYLNKGEHLDTCLKNIKDLSEAYSLVQEN